jgi:hypothetical protein
LTAYLLISNLGKLDDYLLVSKASDQVEGVFGMMEEAGDDQR